MKECQWYMKYMEANNIQVKLSVDLFRMPYTVRVVDKSFSTVVLKINNQRVKYTHNNLLMNT